MAPSDDNRRNDKGSRFTTSARLAIRPKPCSKWPSGQGPAKYDNDRVEALVNIVWPRRARPWFFDNLHRCGQRTGPNNTASCAASVAEPRPCGSGNCARRLAGNRGRNHFFDPAMLPTSSTRTSGSPAGISMNTTASGCRHSGLMIKHPASPTGSSVTTHMGWPDCWIETGLVVIICHPRHDIALTAESDCIRSK